MVTVQPAGSDPLQAPLQPTNVEPAGGAATSWIEVPPANLAEQVLPQLMPVGELVTVPGFDRPMASVYVLTKLAVTDDSAFSATVHVEALPLHAPPQPVKR